MKTGNNPRCIQRGTKIFEGVDHWSAPHLFLTATKQGGGKKKRQRNGCCLKQKKEKCSGATCPLPMSHAALSPLVGEPWGRMLSPGQSATSIGPICKLFQVSSSCGKDWTGLQRGRGEHRGTTREPHLKQHERRQTGFSCRGGGLLEVQVNSWTGMQCTSFRLWPCNVDQAGWLQSVWQLRSKVQISVSH